MTTPNTVYTSTIARFAATVLSFTLLTACGPGVVVDLDCGYETGDEDETGYETETETETGAGPGAVDMPGDDTGDGDGDGDGDPPGDGDGDPAGCTMGEADCYCADDDLDGSGSVDASGECYAGLLCDTSTGICVPL